VNTGLFHLYMALFLRVCKALPSDYGALLTIYRSLLREYRALSIVYGALFESM